MKLRQKEYCHNCDQHVIFEFDDTTERQIILCPNCRHQHYRELDEATILDIQIDQTRGLGQFRMMKMENAPLELSEGSAICESIPIVTKTYNILGYDENGKPLLDGDPIADGMAEGRKVKSVSDRRWGVDPRQRRT